MPAYLAIDWDTSELAVVCGQVTAGRVTVSDRFVLACPDEIDLSSDPAVAGAWLKSELDRRDIAAKQVLVALPRDDVVLRRLDVPDAADRLLPGIVRYQAGNQSTVPLEQLVLDYLPGPGGLAEGGRAVLMATAARSRVDHVRTVIGETGGELAGLGIASLAVLELVARAARRDGCPDHQSHLVVVRTGRRVEISLMRDRHALFTHAARLTGDDHRLHHQMIQGEISRAMLAFAPADDDVTIDRIWLVGWGDESGQLGAELRQRIGCPVEPLADIERLGVEFPDAGVPDEAARFAAALGLLMVRGEPLVGETVDFLRPRQAIVHRHRRKVILAVLAAAAVSAVLAAFCWQRARLSALDREIENKRAALEQLDQVVQQGQPLLSSAAAVGQWQQRDVNWLEQLEALARAMPEPDRIYLANCRLQTVSGETLARVQADGSARERSDVESLYQRLADRSAFRVRPNEIESGPVYEDFPVRFEIDADIVPLPTSAANRE